MDYTSVKQIIKERFSLGTDGYNSFERLLEKETKEYSFLGENNRSIYKIDKELYPHIDDGFKLLSQLRGFICAYDVTFENYADNKITIKGNNVKIFKVATDYYSNNIKEGFVHHSISETEATFRMCEKIASCDSLNFTELYYLLKKIYKTSEYREIKDFCESTNKKGFEEITSYILQKIFEKIGCYKINFTKELYFVISKNFNDFFLCSNGEGWTSCLNPESSSGFWSSLPFLTADSNRSLCFISDLTEKEYLGVKSLKMFKRGWGELDRNGKINTGIFYPAKEYLNDTFFKKLGIGDKIQSINSSFVSKYPLDVFYNKYNVFDFLYQDDTSFSDNDEEPYLRRNNKNHTIIVKYKGKRDYHMCSFKGGLKKLIEEDSEISKFPGLHFCDECYGIVDENYKISYTLITGEKKKTCSSCMEISMRKQLVQCTLCFEKIADYRSYHIGRDNDDNAVFCSTCRPCAACGEHVKKAVRDMNGNIICEKCSSRGRNDEEYEHENENDGESAPSTAFIPQANMGSGFEAYMASKMMMNSLTDIIEPVPKKKRALSMSQRYEVREEDFDE